MNKLDSKIMKKKKKKITIYDLCRFSKYLLPEDKHNPEKPYTSKYQKHIACSYSSKLVSLDN